MLLLKCKMRRLLRDRPPRKKIKAPCSLSAGRAVLFLFQYSNVLFKFDQAIKALSTFRNQYREYGIPDRFKSPTPKAKSSAINMVVGYLAERFLFLHWRILLRFIKVLHFSASKPLFVTFITAIYNIIGRALDHDTLYKLRLPHLKYSFIFLRAMNLHN